MMIASIESLCGIGQFKQAVHSYLRHHPQIYKVVLLVNQAVRAIMMATMMAAMPYAPLTNVAIGFGLSAFYWITVEGNCAFRFALPAFAGAVAYDMSKSALPAIVNGVAFQSFQALMAALRGAWPLALYAVTMTLIIHHDVERWAAAQSGKR